MSPRVALAGYFLIVYAASAAVFVIPISPLYLFPVLVAAAAAAGLGLTAVSGGRNALRALIARLKPRRMELPILAVVLVPPAGVLITLTALSVSVSPAFAPGLFLVGLPIGVVAGFLEEIGWTGFAYPHLRVRFGALPAALLLGILWGLWHLPVVDSLGAASPHGLSWAAFFAAFIAVLVPGRCLICWAYDRTQSLLLAQLMHASSTASLAVLGPQHVTPAQEATWYAAYAALLWVMVGVPAVLRRARQPGLSSATLRRQNS
jgi:membrane protease YdiL (CAAX protease family)